MLRKRYDPQRLLQRVVAGLEREDDRSQQRAVLDLLRSGPLFISEETIRAPQPDTMSEVRAELLRFLRGIVSNYTPREIQLRAPVVFKATAQDGVVSCEAEGVGRDVVILQLVMLVQAVGLPSVRACPAPNPHRGAPAGARCDRLFVKTYRRAFCSSQCQKRAYMRQRRANERQKRERATRRRLLAKGV